MKNINKKISFAVNRNCLAGGRSEIADTKRLFIEFLCGSCFRMQSRFNCTSRLKDICNTYFIHKEIKTIK